MLLSVARSDPEENRRAFTSRWIIFATSWNYIVVTAYFVYAAIISITTCNDRYYHENYSLPIKFKILWLLSSISLTICSLVVIFYWTVLHDFNTPLELNLQSYLLIDRHGINLFLLVVEFFLHIVPIQILHFIYPFGFGLLYAIFNITYFFITGDGVYEFVDWRDNLGPTIGTFIGTMVFIIIMHVVLFFIYLAKSRCANSHSRNVIV